MSDQKHQEEKTFSAEVYKAENKELKKQLQAANFARNQAKRRAEELEYKLQEMESKQFGSMSTLATTKTQKTHNSAESAGLNDFCKKNSEDTSACISELKKQGF